MALKVGDLAAFLTLDADQYERGLQQATAMAQTMPDADIEVDVDDAVARGQLQQVAAVAQAMPDADIQVDADTGAAMGKLAAVRAAVAGVDSADVSRLGGRFTKLAAAIGAAAVVAAGFAVTLGGIAAVGIKTNATLETATLQFETLMGSADEAEEHVRGLFDFAARTPFETEPIIEASRIMETFGGAALNTKENLTLFGDAAAATTQPINEVGFWMARAYADIQAGRPFGEAAARLSEMGVITPQVRSKLEDLQAAGAAGPAVWAELTGSLGRFSGAMEKQAGTWAGITSSLKDMFSMGAAQMAEPLFESLKGLGQAVLDFGNSPAWDTILARGEGVFGKIAGYIDLIAEGVRSGDLSEAFAAMGEGLAGVGSSLGAGLMGAFEEILPRIPEFLLRVVEVLAAMDWQPMAAAMTAGLIAMLMAINWAELTIQATQLLIAIAPDIISGFIEGIIRAAVENPLDFLMLFVSLGFMPVKVLGAFASVLGKIPILGKLLEWIVKAVGGAAQGVMGPVREAVGKIGRKFYDEIVGFFGGAGTWLANAGRNIVDGLIGGIRAAGGAVASALLNLVPTPLRGALAHLFGRSPSPMFEEFGGNMVQGVVNSLLAGIPDVQKAALALAPNMGGGQYAVGSGMAAGAGAGSGWSGNVIVQGNVVTERDLARTIGKVMDERSARRGH